MSCMFLLWVIFYHCFLFCSAYEVITIGKLIKDGELLISEGKKFALGFFTPGKSSYRYLGIWYHNLPQQTVVWVANRDDPINDTSGVLSLNPDGNLVLHCKNTDDAIWSTNVSVTVPSATVTAQLSDIGNLVLIQKEFKTVIWQSFDHPTDTWLPYAKMGVNIRTGQSWFLQSWKTEEDPATGSYSVRFNTSGKAQWFLYNENVPVWRAGSFNGEIFVGIPSMKKGMSAFNTSFTDDENEVGFVYHAIDNSVIYRFVALPSGNLQSYKWDYEMNDWKRYTIDPGSSCDFYGYCGSNSNCDSSASVRCSCLPGFEPRNPTDGYQQNQNDATELGCIRKKGSSFCGDGDGFVKVESVKIPDTSVAIANMDLSMEECEQECLGDCCCSAYAAADVRNGGNGCLTWHGTLMDTQILSMEGHDLYVRVNAIELAKYARKSKVKVAESDMVEIPITSIALIALLVAICVYCFQKRKRDKITMLQLNLDSQTKEENVGNRAQPSLPLFSIKTVKGAANHFSKENYLGQGGFGSVYKGLLVNGQEIAVKRLSKGSGQGIQEFKNEIKLIAKLQHRNLVKLLGYCIHKEEKMLIYEYLPNKILDFFLFDINQRSSLDWDKRFHIIFGIARGVLYLHQDSRLKIIHRDLKASNVLLNATMNPKISDFGMARIFGEDQIQARTRRIVGTYGYMSPEYAMEGQYSTKSDVFSFGVIMLEIISGKRNLEREEERTSPNLIGHVWYLWREGKALEIVDSTLGETFPFDIVLRYIQIGLLCVQESALKRPSMSEVISMLGNEVSLPSPQKPAFLLDSNMLHPESSTSREPSLNGITHTTIDAR